MKCFIDKALLADAIDTVIRAVPSRSSIPAMEGILLEAADGRLTTTAYDLKTAIRTSRDADVEEAGRAVIEAKLLNDIVRRMPDDILALVCEDARATLKSGRTEFAVSTLTADDYPALPDVCDAATLALPAATLKSVIAETKYAISTNEARPAQTGALFDAADGRLNVVACDGFRLAMRTEPLKTAEKLEFIVPAFALGEVERLCGNAKDDVALGVANRHVTFRIGETYLVSRRLDGQFLDYETVIPRNQSVRVTVNAKDLARSIERVGVVVNEKLKAPLRCVIGNGEMAISARTAVGAANDRVKIDGDGGDLEIGFNERYLGEAMKYAPDDTLELQFSAPTSPCVITSAAEDGKGRFTAMVLPVRLKKEEM